MSTVDALLEPIIHSPYFAEILDRLQQTDVDERQRRALFYAEMTPEQKVEFIDGEVILHSPARVEHLDVTVAILTLLHTYVRRRRSGSVYSEKCLCVFPRNDYEPDVVFFGPEKAARILPKTMKFPIPDLVVEVLSDSTASRDRGVKFQDFEAHGVIEYWIVDADTKTVEQYTRQGERLELAMKSSSGELRSVSVPGFVVPVAAFFDEEEHLRAMQALFA